jgi:hypothetical protein
MNFTRIRERAQQRNPEVLVLGLAVRHPQTPRYA